MFGLDLWELALVALGAFLVGIGKGGLPGTGNLTVVIFALVLPTKASVGILLPILIIADIAAVIIYRRHARWDHILKLLPSMTVGIVAGYLLFDRIDEGHIRPVIGAILLLMTALHFLRKWSRRHSRPNEDPLMNKPIVFSATGIVGGFATMVANAAGPVAALYLMACNLKKYAYVGTAAWLFFIVNLLKVPFMIDLGLVNSTSIRLSLGLSVFAIAGAVIAPHILRRIDERIFTLLVWSFVVIGAIKLAFS